MTYKLLYSKTSRDQIRDLHPELKPVIKSRLQKLKENPFAGKSRVLSASLRKRKKSEFSCIFFVRGGCLVCGVYHPRFKIDY